MGRHSKPGVIPVDSVLRRRPRLGDYDPWPVVIIDDLSWIDSPGLEDKIRQIDSAFEGKQ